MSVLYDVLGWLCLILIGAMVVLDVVMIVSLAAPGDERRRMIVWKSSTFTLLGTSGSLVIDIAASFIRGKQMEEVNPFVHLAVTAIIFCICMLYYKRKHGG